MQGNYRERIDRAKEALSQAGFIVIGGGAGLSEAAGLHYSGGRFEENFADFKGRYGMTDMYTAGFYPFGTQEEKWAYWSRHILLNRWAPPAQPLYEALYALVRDREYFVLTTNVDGQFEKAGFDPDRIFDVQGDYGQIQCAKGCHDKLYGDETLVREMAAEQKDCRIPSRLVPRCPACGGEMEVHVRKDMYFVQDKAWYEAADRYDKFIAEAAGKRTVFLEAGVGYNTPTIIRFPFERMVYRNDRASLIRINRDYPEPIDENRERTISFSEEMKKVISDLM